MINLFIIRHHTYRVAPLPSRKEGLLLVVVVWRGVVWGVRRGLMLRNGIPGC